MGSIAQGMLAEFEHEVKTTRKFLERIPGDQLNWRPHERSMTAGELAVHIASIPGAILKIALDDEGSPPSGSTRGVPESVEQLVERLDESAAFVRTNLPTLDDARMMQTYKFTAGGRTLLEVPRAAFLRTVLFNHWYHHRGQLGVYLRLLGAKVPSSYGPSGDEG